MKLKFTFLMAIAFTLSMFVQNKVSATHLAGADMTYVHLGGNMYELTVTLYPVSYTHLTLPTNRWV